MNKKLLFATLSLAALASCSTDDFENQKVVEEVTSPVKFEVINNNVQTRAYMDDGTLRWEASKKDLFTLYFGAASETAVTGHQNATYTTAKDGSSAALTTPTMITQGYAVMVWPVDTTFRYQEDAGLKISIPETLENVEHNITYVSDQINIGAYGAYNDDPEKGTVTAYNTAGKDRTYPVYMRPMSSQLNIIADYAGTDATLNELTTGDDPIEPISLTSVELNTKAGGSTLFTKKIPVQFTDPASLGITPSTQWTKANNAWNYVTNFNVGGIASEGQTNKLTTKVIKGTKSATFLMLPQKKMDTDTKGVEEAAIVVNTYYGKVVVAKKGVAGTKYDDGEWEDAWYRYLSAKPATDADGETTGSSKVTAPDGTQKYKTTSAPEFGMKQTINFYLDKKGSGLTANEPTGANVDRYVKVLLTHLDMSDLHVKDDKQLRDVARVWKKMGLDPVTVYLDGGQAEATKGTTNFEISQKTIKVINEVNKTSLGFQVKPCNKTDEECTQIVITGSSDEQAIQDIAFITYNDVDKSGTFNSGDIQAQVVLAKEAKPWKWISTVKVAADGVERIINKGTMENAAKATLKTAEYDGTQNNVRLQNDGTWDIKTGTILNVQFDVTNNGTVTIEKNAQYRQDGRKNDINTLTTFTNQATNVPKRFGGNDAEIGLVNNSGVFATVALGQIINYGLIEHIEDDAKTYITKNQTTSVSFSNAFSDTNKRGRINLRFSNKNEDNISVSAAASEGFISVTVTADDLEKAGITSDELDASIVGDRVNYIIINSGIKTISKVSPQVQYLEIAAADKKEIAWNVTDPTEYVGLMVLSDVNVKLNTTINVTRATYLGADMYVGGTFTTAAWNGYYGKTETNVASQYITY